MFQKRNRTWNLIGIEYLTFDSHCDWIYWKVHLN